ncbi:ketopantoate reductase family protein [Staphylococcus gallinarum]|uniref:ketopantoate reductase family protein n=1 Tax=Staphylococcus gallinarum TaxID=1293 RepID=UPI00211C96F5|nr:2-dehydropantoate 2-reductase N-terminal domain-containing protein [Staphylococcus gallinarum]MCQ9288188.1 ketopantoate reductase family protein [Staphylococcus gallinarum]
MRILIYGAGVQGRFLAHALNGENNDVTLFARNETKRILEKNGVKLKHTIQKKVTHDHFRLIDILEENDIYDVIFVTMKYSDFYNVFPSLAKNNSKNIVFVGNNANPQALYNSVQNESLSVKNIGFGFLMTGGEKIDDYATVLRFNKGELKVGLSTENKDLNQVLDNIFENVNIKLTYQKQFDEWLLSHAAFILPLNMTTVVREQNGINNKLLNETVAAYNEIYRLIENNGYALIPKAPAFLVKHFKRTSAMMIKLLFKSGVLDQAKGSTKELDALYLEFKKLSNNTAISTANLDSLYQQTVSVSD